MVKHVTWWVCA